MSNKKIELQTPDTFTIPDGREIKLKPVSIVRIRATQAKARKLLLEQNMQIDPPTRPVPGVVLAPGVDPVLEAYNDKTIEEANDDEKKKYEEYKRNQRVLTNTTVGLMFSTLLLRGTAVEIPEDGWEAQQVDDGMVVPTQTDERYVHYLTTELLIPPIVAQECALAILFLSMEGVDPEVLKAFEDSFRRRTSGRRILASDKKDTKKGKVVI